jgi:hypothetical protein
MVIWGILFGGGVLFMLKNKKLYHPKAKIRASCALVEPTTHTSKELMTWNVMML